MSPRKAKTLSPSLRRHGLQPESCVAPRQTTASTGRPGPLVECLERPPLRLPTNVVGDPQKHLTKVVTLFPFSLARSPGNIAFLHHIPSIDTMVALSSAKCGLSNRILVWWMVRIGKERWLSRPSSTLASRWSWPPTSSECCAVTRPSLTQQRKKSECRSFSPGFQIDQERSVFNWKGTAGCVCATSEFKGSWQCRTTFRVRARRA